MTATSLATFMTSEPGIPDSLFWGPKRTLLLPVQMCPRAVSFNICHSLGLPLNIQLSVSSFMLLLATHYPHSTLYPLLPSSKLLSSLPDSPKGFTWAFLHSCTFYLLYNSYRDRLVLQLDACVLTTTMTIVTMQ